MKQRQLRVFKKAALSDLSAICIELRDFIEEPAVILLSGDVGMGKTTLTQSFLKMIDHEFTTSSPSYSMVHEIGDILHADFYRIESSSELIHLELPMLFDGKKMAFIEWARPHLSALIQQTPEEFLIYEITFEPCLDQTSLRDITFYSLEES